MSNLKRQLELQNQVLKYLAEHTRNDLSTSLTDTQVAEALRITVQEAMQAIKTLRDFGLVDTLGSNYDYTCAHITGLGLQRAQHLQEGPQPQGVVINNQFNAPANVQQGPNSTMNIYAGTNTQDVLQLIQGLRNQLQTVPEEHRELVAEQVQDLEEGVRSGQPKATRVLATLTTLVAFLGQSETALKSIEAIAGVFGVKLPGRP